VLKEAAQLWANIPANGELTACHRVQLAHLAELARDRVELYWPAGAARTVTCDCIRVDGGWNVQ
jgi:hypothetical protein